jgi:hypothetical protein
MVTPPPLTRSNIHLLSERLGWPTGAAEAVIALLEEFPAWQVTWSGGGESRWREPGYYAWPATSHMGRVVNRKDPAELREVLELAPELDRWSAWEPPGGWLQF